MKKTITSSFLKKLTKSELTVILQNAGILKEGQSVDYFPSFVKNLEELKISIKETVVVDVPENVEERVMETNISELDLSVRAYNLLENYGIITIHGIVSEGSKLKRYRGIGEKVYRDMLDALEGFQKRESVDCDLVSLMK